MAHATPINPHAVVQKVWLEPDAGKFKVPSAISVSGPSQSNKSHLTSNAKSILGAVKLQKSKVVTHNFH